MTPIRLSDKQVSHTGALRKTNNFSSNNGEQKTNSWLNIHHYPDSPKFLGATVIVIDILIVKVKLFKNLFRGKAGDDLLPTLEPTLFDEPLSEDERTTLDSEES